MVGSEIDQKYLGILAQYTQPFHEELSITLFRLLGLSSLLARKLYRARKQRKLDPTRATKSLDLYRHIIWMSKEGFIMIEDIIQNIIGSLISTQFAELRVLVYKLRASFLHIFVLFDCRYQASTLLPASLLGGGHPPPNTEIESHDYLSVTIEAFKKADELAADLLPAIHPLRLSVKLEYSAFTFDCVRDEDVGRRIAKKAIDDAFVCTDRLEDDAFEDATHLVGALGVFAKRNLAKKQKPQEGPTSPKRPMSYALSQSSAAEFSYVPPHERERGSYDENHPTIDEGMEGDDSGPEDSELYAKQESERRQRRWNVVNGRGAEGMGRPGTADSEDPRDYYEQRNRPLSPIEVDFKNARQPMQPISGVTTGQQVYYEEPGEITPKASRQDGLRNDLVVGNSPPGPIGQKRSPLVPQPAFDARKPPAKPADIADNRRPSTSGSANSGSSKRYHRRKMSADGTPLPKGAGKGVGIPIEQAYEVIETPRFGAGQRSEWKRQLEQQMGHQPQQQQQMRNDVSPPQTQQQFQPPGQTFSPPPPTPPPKDDIYQRKEPLQRWDPNHGQAYHHSSSPPQSPYNYTSDSDVLEDPSVLIEPSELANRHSDSDDKRNAFYQLPEDQYSAPGWQGIASPPIEEYRMRQLSRISEESYSTVGANTSGNGAFTANDQLHRNVSTRSKRSKGSKNSKRSGSGRSTNRNSNASNQTTGTDFYDTQHDLESVHEDADDELREAYHLSSTYLDTQPEPADEYFEKDYPSYSPPTPTQDRLDAHIHVDHLEPPLTPTGPNLSSESLSRKPPRSPRDRQKMHLPPTDPRLGLESPVYEEELATAVPLTRPTGPLSPVRTGSFRKRPQTSYANEPTIVGNVNDRKDMSMNRNHQEGGWVDMTPRDRDFQVSPVSPEEAEHGGDYFGPSGGATDLNRADSYRRGEKDVLSVTPLSPPPTKQDRQRRPIFQPAGPLNLHPTTIPTPSPNGSAISVVSSRADPTVNFENMLAAPSARQKIRSAESSATNITQGTNGISYFHDAPTSNGSTTNHYGRSEVTSPVTSFEVDMTAGFGDNGRGTVYGRRDGNGGFTEAVGAAGTKKR